MVANYFSQFDSPYLWLIPLILIAIVFPTVLFPTRKLNWLNNRLSFIQNFSVYNILSQLFQPLNSKGYKWILLLSTLMVLIISLNTMGILPYTFTPTTQLSLNLALALPLWLATVTIGLVNNPTASLSHLLPQGAPTLLIPILIVIETISLLIRPMSLGVRLTANLTAGHLLIQLFSSAAFSLVSTLPPVAALTSLVLLALTVLEMAVAVIQAYVFVLLLSLYLQENT
uniref:ATP synthase subunit a n=1 Tax=Danionella mirifica TaxID=487619 RepID=F3Y701_9TELE|nr:ATPase subunit 6 [Danionella mirifica]